MEATATFVDAEHSEKAEYYAVVDQAAKRSYNRALRLFDYNVHDNGQAHAREQLLN